MKLSSFALLLALVPFASAVDSPPNLRGIAVALTDGESRYPGVVTPPCKTETKWCSTSPTAPDSHKCCEVDKLGTTQPLTCEPDDSVAAQSSSSTFDGVCVAQNLSMAGGDRNGGGDDEEDVQ